MNRQVYEYYCVPFWPFGCGAHTKANSNEVKFTFTACPDPSSFNNYITGPAKVSCKDTGLPSYTLHLGNECMGIKNITWQLPAGWSGDSPISGRWATTVTVKPFPDWARQRYGAPGGIISATVQYEVGDPLVVSFTVQGENAPTVDIDPTTYYLCKGKGATITPVVSNLAGTASYSWTTSGNLNIDWSTTSKQSLVVKPEQWSTNDQYVSVLVTDNTTKCLQSAGATVVSSTGWRINQPSILSTHIRASTFTTPNIVAEAKGNIYYVGDLTTGPNAGASVLCTYRWDAGKSTWVNTPFPQNNPPFTGSSSIAISENPSANKNIIYYIDDEGSLSCLNMTATDTLTINYYVSNIEGGLSVEGSNIIFRDKQLNLWLFNMDSRNLIQINSAGNVNTFPKIYQNKIFWAEGNDANIWTYDIASKTKKQVLYSDGSAARLFTQKSILTDYQNGIYFASAPSGFIRRINTVNMQASKLLTDEYWPNKAPRNGEFTINKSTGVIYFGNGDINQMYIDATDGKWKTREIVLGASQTGYMLYSYPNTFYINSVSNIAMAWFWTGVCEPGIQRTGTEEVYGDTTTKNNTEILAGSIFNVFPNPAVNNINILLDLYSEGPVKLKILNGQGIEIKQQYVDNLYAGRNEISWALDHIQDGLYFIQAYQGDNYLGLQKLIIKK